LSSVVFSKTAFTKSLAYPLWLVLIILDYVLVNFSSIVHRFSFTTNHIHSL